jgi:hypothetical protein
MSWLVNGSFAPATDDSSAPHLMLSRHAVLHMAASSDTWMNPSPSRSPDAIVYFALEA